MRAEYEICHGVERPCLQPGERAGALYRDDCRPAGQRGRAATVSSAIEGEGEAVQKRAGEGVRKVGQGAHKASGDAPSGPLLGAHMSIAGGVQQALYRAQQAGCDAVQIFTKPSRQWQAKPLTDADIAVFQEAQQATGITTVVAHDSYLLNLAAADPTLWEKSLHAFIDEMERCEALHIAALVAHPGAHVGAGEEAGIEHIARAIDVVHQSCAGFRTRITLEITAGQGTCLGYRFAHLRAILEQV